MYSYKQICTASCVHALGNSTNIIHSALFKAAVCLNLYRSLTNMNENRQSKKVNMNTATIFQTYVCTLFL